MSKKPIGQLEIDWSHPLADGLILCVIDAHNLIPEDELTNINVATQADYMSMGTGKHLRLPDDSKFSLMTSGSTGSFVTDIRYNTASACHLFSKDDEFACALQLNGAGLYPRLDLYGGNSGASSNIAINEWHRLAYTWKSGTRQNIYKDGIVYHSATNSNTSTDNTNEVVIGNRSGFYDAPFKGDMRFAYLYRRELSQEEITSLHADPYQLLKTVKTVQSQVYPALFGVSGGAITGTSAVTAGNVTASATGIITKTGTASVTVENVTVSATGIMSGEITGIANLIADDVSVSASGTREITSSGAVVVEDISVLATGQTGSVISGSANAVVDDATVSATGIREVTGNSSVIVDNVTVTATGQRIITGLITLSANNATVTAAGQREIKGTATIIIADVTVIGQETAMSIPDSRVFSLGGRNKTFNLTSGNRTFTLSTSNRNINLQE